MRYAKVLAMPPLTKIWHRSLRLHHADLDSAPWLAQSTGILLLGNLQELARPGHSTALRTIVRGREVEGIPPDTASMCGAFNIIGSNGSVTCSTGRLTADELIQKFGDQSIREAPAMRLFLQQGQRLLHPRTTVAHTGLPDGTALYLIALRACLDPLDLWLHHTRTRIPSFEALAPPADGMDLSDSNWRKAWLARQSRQDTDRNLRATYTEAWWRTPGPLTLEQYLLQAGL